MDPTAYNFGKYLFPTAIYTDSNDPKDVIEPTRILVSGNASSPFPCNSNQKSGLCWAIDGGEADGTRFFAIPNAARGRAPLRIDTHIPPSYEHPKGLRQALKSDSSMFLPSTEVGGSILCQHLLRALDYWSSSWTGFDDAYFGMPFGSRILISQLDEDVRRMKIELVPSYDYEKQLLSIKALQALWELDENAWPPTLDLEHLELHLQPYPTISLVRVRGKGDELLVFKSFPDDVKYFYHELKVLLTLAPHPNIIRRPRYIVTKRSRFGGKQGVCGFMIDYHPAGQLREALSRVDVEPICTSTRLRWARDMTSALIHISNSELGFFSNLKLNNIVLASDIGVLRPVLIDFEQRLGPSSWSPPEVHYVTFISWLAMHSPNDVDRQRYAKLLKAHIPDWQPMGKKSRYANPMHGYCDPWPLLLSNGQAEAAQVFMLGKLLWCLFEQTHTINTTITIDTFREAEKDISFPCFRYTPPHLRECIRLCTSGAMEWSGRHTGLMRRGSRIYPWSQADLQDVSLDAVAEVARTWWRREVEDAEHYIRAYIAASPADEQGTVTHELFDAIAQRPTLRQVLQALDVALEEGPDE